MIARAHRHLLAVPLRLPACAGEVSRRSHGYARNSRPSACVATVRSGTATASANLVLYVYVDGTLIATTTATVTDVPAGGSVPVHFSGADPWKPGQKVLLLALA